MLTGIQVDSCDVGCELHDNGQDNNRPDSSEALRITRTGLFEIPDPDILRYGQICLVEALN